MQDGIVVVGKGLEVGEKVVVDGQYRLTQVRGCARCPQRPRQRLGPSRCLTSFAQRAAAVETLPMNISEPFIRRPIATSLMMLGVLVFGIGAYRAAAGGGLAQCRFPDNRRVGQLSRRQPRHDGLGGGDAARTAIRRDPGARPDDLDQRRRVDVDHAAIRPGAQYRRRRGDVLTAINAATRRLAQGPAQSADLSKNQPGRPAGADLRGAFRRPADLQGRRLRLHDPGAEAFDRARAFGRSRIVRPAALRDARPGRSRRARGARPRPRGCAQRAGGDPINRPKGVLDRRAADLHARHQRPAVQRGAFHERHRRLPQRRAGAARRMSPMSSTECRTAASAPGTTTPPAEVLAIQRQPGANIIELVDTIKEMMPQLEAVDPALGQGRLWCRTAR